MSLDTVFHSFISEVTVEKDFIIFTFLNEEIRILAEDVQLGVPTEEGNTTH